MKFEISYNVAEMNWIGEKNNSLFKDVAELKIKIDNP